MTQVTPYIDEHFEGQIWKFTIDSQANLLFCEVRNPDNKEVSFASIDLNTGNTNFNNLGLPEKWLSGLDSAFNGTMFIHGFQSAQSPIRKGITAIDGATGKQLWSNYIDTISHISVNGPIAYNSQVQPVKLLLLNAETGATLRTFNASIDVEMSHSINLPQILTDLPSEFIPFFDGELKGNIHYMEHNSFRIVSLHTLNYGVLTQLLFITQNGDLVYRDLLNDKIQKLQPEAFIMYQGKLVCIKNTRELKIFNL
jgi:hypothetical protein